MTAAMNQTAFNGTLSCSSFDTLSSILELSTTQGYNLSLLAQDCPEICNLAWGTGNPDLSGIGVMVSYILQYVLTTLYGPLFWVLHQPATDNWRNRIENHHAGVFSASSIFSISVAIATLVWLPQRDLLFEVTVMYFLNTMSFLSVLSLAMSALMFKRPYEFGDDDSIKRCIVVVLSCIVEFALYVAVVVRLKAASLDFDGLPALVEACLSYKAILPGIPVENNAKAVEDLRRYSDALGYGSTTGAILWSTLGMPVRYILGILGLAAILAAIYAIFLLVTRAPKALGGVCSVAFWIGATFCLSQLQQKRNALGDILGKDYEDNEWGFGQVLAVTAWLPMLIQTLPGIAKSCLALAVFETGRSSSKHRYHGVGGSKSRVTASPVKPPSHIREDEEAAHVEVEQNDDAQAGHVDEINLKDRTAEPDSTQETKLSSGIPRPGLPRSASV